MIRQALNQIRAMFAGNVARFCANPINKTFTPCDPNDLSGSQRCTVDGKTYDDDHPACDEDTQTLLSVDGCADIP